MYMTSTILIRNNLIRFGLLVWLAKGLIDGRPNGSTTKRVDVVALLSFSLLSSLVLYINQIHKFTQLQCVCGILHLMIVFFVCFNWISCLIFISLAEPLKKIHSRQKEGLEEEYSFEGALGASKKSVIQDSMSVLLVSNELA